MKFSFRLHLQSCILSLFENLCTFCLVIFLKNIIIYDNTTSKNLLSRLNHSPYKCSAKTLLTYSNSKLGDQPVHFEYNTGNIYLTFNTGNSYLTFILIAITGVDKNVHRF